MNEEDIKKFMEDIPQKPQFQGGLNVQLALAVGVLDRVGLYDASDFIKKVIENVDKKLKEKI